MDKNMREILFRAKQVNNGEWVEGYLFDDGMAEVEHYFVGRIVVEPYKGTACDDWDITGIDFCEVNPENLCQYTGLKDKNGNRIWENDIVQTPFRRFVVTYFDGVWGDRYGVAMRESIFGEGGVVIGNVFDNPELMEK